MTYDFDFSAPLAYWPELLAGARTTLGLSLVATFFGFLLGVFCALANTGRTRWLARRRGRRQPARASTMSVSAETTRSRPEVLAS